MTPACAGYKWAIEQAERLDTPIIYVFGNHEYYGHNLRLIEKAKDLVEDNHQIYVLDNDEIVIGGIRFLGATLWTDFDLYGNRPLAMVDAVQTINDYRKIRVPPSYRRLQPNDVLDFHLRSRTFLENRPVFAGPTVVVTHHAPSERSIPACYRLYQSNPCYASRLDTLVARFDAWIHGHVHYPVMYRVGKCQVVSNPMGYWPNELCPGFENRRILNVQT